VLGGGAPVYHREAKEPDYLKETREFDFTSLPQSDNIQETFLKVLASPNIASKKWVYEQYDSMVRTNTMVGPGCDAAVIYVKGTNKAIVMKTDCNARYVYLNPKEGTKIAVAEAARNIVCSGGMPLAITNCLNFGNPYKPEIYWQFANAIEGMKEACSYFDTPVTGGNVSFYNESPEAAVYPTPTIGMLGLIEDLNNVTTSYLKEDGDLVYLLGEDKEEMGGSEYLKIIHGKVKGDSPQLDLKKEKLLHTSTLSLISNKLIKSAHDISEGGIACCIAECCIIDEQKMIGAEVTIPVKTREDFSLFSESQSRIVVSVSPGKKDKFESTLREFKQPFMYLGNTGGDSLKINDYVDVELDRIADLFYNTIPNIMKREE